MSETPSKKRLYLVAVLVCALGLGAWFAVQALGPGPLPKDFPTRPDLAAAPPVLVELIDNTETKARSHPESGEEIGTLGMVYHANGFYAQAESAYGLASRLAGDDYRWVYYQALVKEEQGQEKAQFQLLQRTVEIRPDYVPALQKLGDIYSKQDNPIEAARHYSRSVRAAGEKESPQAVFALGRLAARGKEWSKAVDLLAPLASTHPYLRPTHQLLGEAYEALGDLRGAEQARRSLLRPDLIPVPPVRDPLYQELVTLSCSSTRLLKEAGLLSRFGQPAEAIRVARRALEIEPSDADVHHLLARTLLDSRGGDPQAVDEALGHLAEGLRQRPDDLVPLYYFAAFFFRQQKTDGAVERLRGMLRERAGKAESHYYLGLMADRLGETEGAALQYKEALRLDPGYPEPCDAIGLLFVGAGQLNEAIGFFEKAVKLKPTFTRARCNLGVALEGQGRISEAIEQYREALRLKPNDGEAHMFLAIALLKTGRIEESTGHFRDAVSILPDHAQAHYGLACALVMQRKVDEAVAEFHETLRLKPDHQDARMQLQRLERN